MTLVRQDRAQRVRAVAPRGAPKGPISPGDRILQLQRTAGNAAVARAAQRRMLQRDLIIDRSLAQTHGLLIDHIAKAPNARKLFEYCKSRRDTTVRFRGRFDTRDEFGETMCHVTDNDGYVHDIDRPGTVDWNAVDQESPIEITVFINIGFVFGQAEDAETLLHEIDVHALDYLQFIQQMRTAPDARAIRRIWEGAARGTSSGDRQHRRLAAGRQRRLTQDIRHVGQEIGLGPELEAAYKMDVDEHSGYL